MFQQERPATEDRAGTSSESEHASSRATSEPCVPVPELDPGNADASAWRDELSVRLTRYRARRRVRPPRYPSLNLQFDALGSSGAPTTPGLSSVPIVGSVSDRALALDGAKHGPLANPAANPQFQLQQPTDVFTEAFHQPSTPTAKIIEFPRFAWGPPPPPPDQLGEPVSDRPRILEVPEVAPPPPALGGITIEVPERNEPGKRPGIDIPLQSVPLGLRLVAALIDGLIIASASAVFGYIFWKVAAVRPPLIQTLGLAAGIPCLFWAFYHYLMIVYAATTPGLRAAGLEPARFDGTPISRSLRRWRVLASFLSALSIGMGYAWVFLDEDALCWHDRITHTYLAPRNRNAKSSPAP